MGLGAYEIWLLVAIPILSLHSLKMITARSADNVEGMSPNSFSKDYQDLQTILEHSLAGTAEEKAKIVDLMLQFLAEIDLPTLCEVVLNDTNESNRDFLQVPIKSTEINANLLFEVNTPNGPQEHSVTSGFVKNIDFSEQETIHADPDIPVAISSSQKQVARNFQDVFEAKRSSVPATYRYHRNELRNFENNTKRLKQALTDGDSAHKKHSHVLDNLMNVLDDSDYSLQKHQTDSVSDIQFADKWEQIPLLPLYKQFHSEDDSLLLGNNPDEKALFASIRSTGMKRPRAQLFSQSLILNDWINDNKQFHLNKGSERGEFRQDNKEDSNVDNIWSHDQTKERKAIFIHPKQDSKQHELNDLYVDEQKDRDFESSKTPKSIDYSNLKSVLESQHEVDYLQELRSTFKTGKQVTNVPRETVDNNKDANKANPEEKYSQMIKETLDNNDESVQKTERQKKFYQPLKHTDARAVIINEKITGSDINRDALKGNHRPSSTQSNQHQLPKNELPNGKQFRLKITPDTIEETPRMPLMQLKISQEESGFTSGQALSKDYTIPASSPERSIYEQVTRATNENTKSLHTDGLPVTRFTTGLIWLNSNQGITAQEKTTPDARVTAQGKIMTQHEYLSHISSNPTTANEIAAHTVSKEGGTTDYTILTDKNKMLKDGGMLRVMEHSIKSISERSERNKFLTTSSPLPVAWRLSATSYPFLKDIVNTFITSSTPVVQSSTETDSHVSTMVFSNVTTVGNVVFDSITEKSRGINSIPETKISKLDSHSTQATNELSSLSVTMATNEGFKDERKIGLGTHLKAHENKSMNEVYERLSTNNYSSLKEGGVLTENKILPHQRNSEGNEQIIDVTSSKAAFSFGDIPVNKIDELADATSSDEPVTFSPANILKNKTYATETLAVSNISPVLKTAVPLFNRNEYKNITVTNKPRKIKTSYKKITITNSPMLAENRVDHVSSNKSTLVFSSTNTSKPHTSTGQTFYEITTNDKIGSQDDLTAASQTDENLTSQISRTPSLEAKVVSEHSAYFGQFIQPVLINYKDNRKHVKELAMPNIFNKALETSHILPETPSTEITMSNIPSLQISDKQKQRDTDKVINYPENELTINTTAIVFTDDKNVNFVKINENILNATSTKSATLNILPQFDNSVHQAPQRNITVDSLQKIAVKIASTKANLSEIKLNLQKYENQKLQNENEKPQLYPDVTIIALDGNRLSDVKVSADAQETIEQVKSNTASSWKPRGAVSYTDKESDAASTKTISTPSQDITFTRASEISFHGNKETAPPTTPSFGEYNVTTSTTTAPPTTASVGEHITTARTTASVGEHITTAHTTSVGEHITTAHTTASVGEHITTLRTTAPPTTPSVGEHNITTPSTTTPPTTNFVGRTTVSVGAHNITTSRTTAPPTTASVGEHNITTSHTTAPPTTASVGEHNITTFNTTGQLYNVTETTVAGLMDSSDKVIASPKEHPGNIEQKRQMSIYDNVKNMDRSDSHVGKTVDTYSSIRVSPKTDYWNKGHDYYSDSLEYTNAKSVRSHTGLHDWINNQPKPSVFIDPWKAYNIAVSKSKSKHYSKQMSDHSHVPEIHLYSDYRSAPAPDNKYLENYLWKARPWSESTNKDIRFNKILPHKPELYQNKGTDVGNSVEHQIKNINTIHDLSTQAEKIRNANHWGNRFSQGYYGRVFDDHRGFMTYLDSSKWSPFYSQDMINFDVLDRKNSKDYATLQKLENKDNSFSQDTGFHPSENARNGYYKHTKTVKTFPLYSDREAGQGRDNPTKTDDSLKVTDTVAQRAVIIGNTNEKNETPNAEESNPWNSVKSASSFGTPAPDDYKCPGLFGYHRDPQNCQAFFICSWGMAHRVVCPQETLYNAKEAVCDWAVNVRCSV